MRRSRRACPPRRYVDLFPPTCSVCRERPALDDGLEPPVCVPCFEAELEKLRINTDGLSDGEAAELVVKRLGELGIPPELLGRWTDAA